MKKVILLTITLLTFLTGYSQNKLDSLGLISELAYIKVTSENLIRNINPEEKKEVREKKILAYAKLQAQIDQFNLQLISDIQSKNRLSVFRKIDKYLKTNGIPTKPKNFESEKKTIKPFLNALIKIKKTHDELLKTDEFESKNIFANNAVGQATGVVSAVVSAFKTFSELREKKVSKTASLLSGVRLSNYNDLLQKKASKSGSNDGK